MERISEEMKEENEEMKEEKEENEEIVVARKHNDITEPQTVYKLRFVHRLFLYLW